MMKNFFRQKNTGSVSRRQANASRGGYTIIETMIAVSLFLIIVVTGMGALLNANLIHQKSASARNIMDNLSFIMEDMGRNLRTGYTYRCVTGVFSNINITTPRSCPSGGAIAFENAFGSGSSSSDQWVYKVESQDGGTTYNLYKSINSGTTWVQLNPSEVAIDSVSGFTVTGAEPPPGNLTQPFVTIKLSGKITIKNVVIPFSLQTSVSQRLVDI
jgi:hypothetical protein